MIARSTGLARSPVSDYWDRVSLAGRGWSLPPMLTDPALEALLDPGAVQHGDQADALIAALGSYPSTRHAEMPRPLRRR
jgi:hypothetical protein